MVSETPLFQQQKNVYEGICIPRTNILPHEFCLAQRVFAVSDVRKTAAPRQVCRACAGTLFIIAWEYINMSSVSRVRSTSSNDTSCVSNFQVQTGVTVTFTCLRATTLKLVYDSILGTFGWAHFPPEKMGRLLLRDSRSRPVRVLEANTRQRRVRAEGVLFGSGASSDTAVIHASTGYF